MKPFDLEKAVNGAPELTDTQILEGIRELLEWDGNGYWLPDWCIKEIDYDKETDFTPGPTPEEFREVLVKRLKNY
jgi:hypothetical protein